MKDIKNKIKIEASSGDTIISFGGEYAYLDINDGNSPHRIAAEIISALVDMKIIRQLPKNNPCSKRTTYSVIETFGTYKI